MKQFVVVDKRIGQTPLMALEEWKRQNPLYASIPACYAGRLDPMASGKLLLLLGEECKRQKAFSDLDKEYEIEVLLDVGSDTGDVLGIPEYVQKESNINNHLIVTTLARECGEHMRAYPTFSSKTVKGKPLFLHALEGTLGDIEIPKHSERIYNSTLQSFYALSGQELKMRVLYFLDRVPRTDEPSKRLGEDFRVDSIRAHWKTLFESVLKRNFTVLRLKVTCASGTYMRSLAGRIGESLGTKALALSIKRTKLGNYMSLWRGVGWWTQRY